MTSFSDKFEVWAPLGVRFFSLCLFFLVLVFSASSILLGVPANFWEVRQVISKLCLVISGEEGAKANSCQLQSAVVIPDTRPPPEHPCPTNSYRPLSEDPPTFPVMYNGMHPCSSTRHRHGHGYGRAQQKKSHCGDCYSYFVMVGNFHV